ncbi:MAG: tetratricopeptide repeat protein [Chlorobium sp.]|nr:tetratricopeptide repeat protein [Chlorobium sp.]MCW8814802.1 tetratricopeptide repeat protein [Chlorobium sp.]MCW8818990.1 tetratricopeptide repeat protein [Ignavibacteriaceae bacterium]
MIHKTTIPAGIVLTLFLSILISHNLSLSRQISLNEAHAYSAGKKHVSSESTKGLEKGDDAFYALDYETADTLYRAFLEDNPDNAAVYWKLARLYVSMGEALPPEHTADRHPYLKRAVEYAERSIQLNDKLAEGHTWLAASLGVLADNAGPREKIKRANIIKSELDRALELNPQDDIALSILGSFNREIASMGWMEKVFAKTFLGSLPKGSYENAEILFKKAISSNPRVIRHYYELGKLYIDLKRYEDALLVLNEALKKPILMKSDTRRIKNSKILIEEISEKIEE